MRIRSATLLTLGSLGLTSALAAQDAGEQTVDMSYKAVKKWSFVLPQETWTDAGGGIKVAHANGDRFAAQPDGLALALSVDTNGDGKVDKKVKGAKGYLVLKADAPEGGKLSYAVRFKAEGKAYKFASSGVMRGRLNGAALMLIDQNNNGLYNEVGVDAMVVGKSQSASYLSSVVNLGGTLFEIDVAPDGKSVTARPFAGESGELDVASGYDSKGKLLSAVVKSSDGKYSFQLAKGGMTVPAGEYTLVTGLVGKDKATVKVRQGKLPVLAVNAGEKQSLNWGTPVMAEFAFTRKGQAVEVAPTAVKYYGKSGEEYYDFPQTKSPKFLVYDERTEKLLKTGRFGT